MGSQTLEILRQGVWASMTGGWFYDPHQNVFCNAVHLYLWLFLLCTPFVTYLYFPKTISTWAIYCLTTGLTIAIVKIINLALHVMYDEAQIISENRLKQTIKALRETSGDDDGGIEMQVLGANGGAQSSGNSAEPNASNNISQANSALSIDFNEQGASIIDLKVDVHRKNSSESSSDISNNYSSSKKAVQTSTVQTHNAEVCQTANYRRSLKIKSKSEEAGTVCNTLEVDKLKPTSSSSKSSKNCLDINTIARDDKKLRSKLQRQISLDSEQIGMGSIFTRDSGVSAIKLQRHRSTESNVEHLRHSKNQHFYNPHAAQLQSVPSDLYYIPDDDEDAYLNQQKTPMRKDSNSTMSALQLPTGSSSNGSAAAGSRVRRHSNTTGKPGSLVSVRRIKSAALETCCPQPSVSNLSPHPNSVETIGSGQTIRNPQHTMLPPPSKSLVRNAHLNLFPKGGGSGSGSLAQIGTSEPVYPIAELADERSLHETIRFDTDNSEESDGDDDEEEDDDDDDEEEDLEPEEAEDDDDADDDDDDEEDEDDDENEIKENVSKLGGATKALSSQEDCSSTSESDLDRPQTQSTDSDTENNGSRSPLLDVKSRMSYYKMNAMAIASSNKIKENAVSVLTADKLSNKQSAVFSNVDGATNNKNSLSNNNNNNNNAVVNSQNTKSEDSGCPSSDCDQASASSKDMLLTKENKPSTSERMWLDFSMDSNNISVDVTDPGEGSSKTCAGVSSAALATTGAILKELKEAKSLGAIPKTTIARERHRHRNYNDPNQYYVDLEEIIRTSMEAARGDVQVSSSRASSWSASSRRFSGGSSERGHHITGEFDRPPVDVLQQTKDGWVVKSSLNNPALASARGDPPPLIPIYNNARRTPYVCFHPTNVPPQVQQQIRLSHPRLRHNSTKSRTTQNSSFDTTASSSRDDENIGASGGTTVANVPKDVQCAWDYYYGDEKEARGTMKASLLMQIDMPHPAEQLAHMGDTSAANSGAGGLVSMNINSVVSGVEFSDTLFCDYWRHFNLPPEKQVQPKRFYKYPFSCLGFKKEVKISMDRLQLLALLDRDLGWFPAILAIILAAMVSILGSVVLRLAIYKDLFAFIFCFVIAGSQYSLLKSVQPDAASPIHGFNKTVAYSRPIYFCLCSALLIMAHQFTVSAGDTSLEGTTVLKPITLFSIPFMATNFFVIMEYFMSLVLLLLPVLFSLGLFPQINTFLMYILEQIDMHMFGGSAVCSLLSGFLALFRSIIACLILYGPAFGGLSEPRGSQHILFSLFCSWCLAISYHLSRSASDVSCLWALIKSSFALHADDEEEDKEKSQTDQTDIHEDDEDDTSKKIVDQGSSSPELANIALNTTNAPSSSAAPMIHNAAQPDNTAADLEDPLPKKLQSTVNARLKNDFLVCLVVGILVFSLHCSTVFTVLQPELSAILSSAAVALGFLLHYIVPQMRKHLPWLCFAKPILKQNEFAVFEPRDAAKVMWFEDSYVYLCFFERNILYPLVFLSALTADSMTIAHKFGPSLGAAVVVVCGLKCFRSAYSDPSSQYLILVFSLLFFRLDFQSASETFLIDYFLVAIVYKKFSEFLLKLQFIVTYIAPWQITWGSAFHAFAQPFSVPHSAMLFLQAAISAVLSTPLNPFLGSAIFLTSYVRPIKFWERDYNTRRIDHSNTRLSSQLERDLGADDNNLNSIFYEHLTRSLQHSLCGDLLLGRWGNVSQGDCFVLASDYLNCLVHIIELGNGLCTFQMRGLEFRGTYCQQREVEAISEGVEDNEGCCCCAPGHLPHMLSANAMFSTRWLAWQVVASKYILEGYSISDNLAQATLQVFEFRKVLITYYVKSIIYYTIRSPKLQEWLQSPAIQDALRYTETRSYVDLDPIFNHNLDEDYDFRAQGITRHSFCGVYMNWVQYCWGKRYNNNRTDGGDGSEANQSNNNTQQNQQHQKRTSPRSSSNLTPSPRDVHKTAQEPIAESMSEPQESSPIAEEENPIITRESSLISLVLALGVLGRRTLATASHNNSLVTVVELFLHGLHALFKGDFRITSPRDEWVFADMDLLHSVVAPAVKMSLKLHQDHFLSPDEYEDPATLYSAIETHTQELVISHEADPLWRNAVLRGAPNLLALRHVMEDGSDEYRLIRLTKRFLSFRVIKLNRECVRGLWAGQQQELIYLRNRNPERGSIQNAKQALRNIINSSCDQPIGYPIYVSPLTTSYAETNDQLSNIIGGAITLEKIHKIVVGFCQRVRKRCREGCSSGSATLDTEMGDLQGVYCNATPTPNNTLSGTTGTLSYGSQSLSGAGNRGSLASMGKPTSSTLFAGLLNRERESDREGVRERAAASAASCAAVSGVSIKHRNSMLTKSDRERRATLPASSDRPEELVINKDLMMTAAVGSVELKQQHSTEFYLPTPGMTSYLKPNSSYSSGNLGARNTRNLLISTDRKSKSEERHTSGGSSRISDEFSDHTSSAVQPHSLPPPPRIGINKKVIIVDSGEIYDCLDLGRRIDVDWPNESMRSSGGRSSWKEWQPQEGMVGFVVHYWQPNHPDSHFRSNFNRTLFLLQIGERYVPVGENGVKEYNTIGSDERIKIVHIPKEELKINQKEVDDVEDNEAEEANNGNDIDATDKAKVISESCNVTEDNDDDENGQTDEKSEASEDYVLSIDHDSI